MSWIDRVKTQYTIVTGDGKGYLPDWLNATKHTDFNIAEFVFKGVQGSLVRRGEPRGTQYNIEIYFQGLNHLDTAKAFEDSAADKRAWNIKHPLYGALLVQPVNLTYDNEVMNVTKITGLVIETLGASTIFLEESEPDTITANANSIGKQLSATYTSDVPSLKSYDINAIRGHINDSYRGVMAQINNVQANVDRYTDAYNRANALVNTTIYDTQKIIEATQRLISTPFNFADTVVNRLKMFELQAEIFNRDVARILALQNRPTATLKRLYENNSAQVILGMCLSTITNIGNAYIYRPNVLSVIGRLITVHNTFLANLNLLQSLNGGGLDAYLPNPVNITQMSQLVKATTAALMNLAAGAKQQRTLTLLEPRNVIELADELYGMQPDDSTIKTLIDNNNIGKNEFFMIEPGRQIIYYV